MTIAPLTFAEITTRAMGNGRFSASQRADVMVEVTGRYGEVLALENWTFLDRTDTVTVSAATVALPAGAGQVTSLWLNTDACKLEPVTLDAFERIRLGYTSPGKPGVFTVLGDNLLVSPTPDASYAATLVSRSDPDSVATGSTDFPILPAWTHPALAAGAAASMLLLENDPTGVPLEQRFQQAIDGMRRQYLSTGPKTRQWPRSR